jgi:hypothetical protein
MYIPWSLEDAREKLLAMFKSIDTNTINKYNIGKISDWQNGTIDRTIDVLEGNGTQWARNSWEFRRHLTEKKYG